MEFRKNLLTHAIQIMTIGLVCSYSTFSFALETKTLAKHASKLVANKQDCFAAAKECLLQVTPIATKDGHKDFDVTQVCDPFSAQMLYLYKFPLNEQLSQRKFLGEEFCNGTVSISDMELPFSKGVDIQDANDGLLLIATAESGLNDIANLLNEMTKLATEAANEELTTEQMSDLNTEFQQLISVIRATIYSTNFNGINLLTYAQGIDIPINRGQKHIFISLPDLNNDANLNLSKLDVLNKADTRLALNALSNAEFAVSRALIALNRSKPDLQVAIQHDATITTIDLNDDIIVVKKTGFAAE